MALNPIEEARAFVMNQVQSPALASSTLPASAKNKVKSTNVWLSKFRRVGDLADYLARFDSGTNNPLYLEMKQHGLQTFEDVRQGFLSQFDAWTNDKTRASDFVIGRAYGAHEILIFANAYDTRSGGMFVLESGGKPSAVLIKATLGKV
jgi:5-methylcytosine-specific restriction protein A